MICFLAWTLTGRDGGSRAGADILLSMLAPGREITVVCRNRCWLPSEIGGRSVQPPRWLVAPPPRRRAGRLNASPKALAKRVVEGVHDVPLRLRIDRALRQVPPTLTIHNGFPVPGAINSEILERSSNRLIVVHSSPEAVPLFQRSSPALSLEWVSERLRGADSLIFVTPQIREAWFDIAGLTQTQTFIVPNTTRESEAQSVMVLGREELRQSLSLPRDAFIVSCVGKVDPAKGQDVLIKALPKMIDLMPNLCVVFVGGITPFGQCLPAEVDAMGLGQHVVFVGGRDDPYSFIRASDMLIHPSRAEGQGIVLLEAMILRTPVLATSVGGIPFAIEHGKSGWLVPPNDAAAIAAGFETLIRNPALRERFAAAGEARYWATFSKRLHRERIQSALEACG